MAPHFGFEFRTGPGLRDLPLRQIEAVVEHGPVRVSELAIALGNIENDARPPRVLQRLLERLERQGKISAPVLQLGLSKMLTRATQIVAR